MLFTKYADGSVELFGDIIEGSYDWDTYTYIPTDPAYTELKNFLIEQKGTPVKITLRSDGGSYFTGQVFAALFTEHGQVELTLTGAVASAATLMVVAAKSVRMYKGANLMIHRVEGSSRGTGETLIKTGEFFQSLDRTVIASYVDVIAARGKLVNNSMDETTKRVKKLYDAETWLTADESLALGLVDEVTASSNPMPIFNITNFAPKGILNEQQEADFLKAVVRPDFEVLKNFEAFGLQIRAKSTKKPEAPTEPQKPNIIAKAKAVWNKAMEAINQGYEDAFGKSDPTEIEGADSANNGSNILNSQNQNPEQEDMDVKAKLEAALKEVAELKAAAAERLQLEATLKEAEDLKAAAKTEEEAAAKAAKDAEQVELAKKQEELRQKNLQQASGAEQNPSGQNTKPTVEKGKNIIASVENLPIFASLQPETYARMAGFDSKTRVD